MSLLLLQSLRDSVATSVSMNLFESRERASMAHIFNSKFLEIPLDTFTDVDNFNPDRLQSSAVRAYPVHDRPRSDDDIRSVDYYQSQIQEGGQVTPIWLLLQKNGKYLLLDGAHRIVASYILDQPYIPSFVIMIKN